jgi:dTDP-4-amino-4,6-dideoxygalactose transaminase
MIAFTKPFLTGKELTNIEKAMSDGLLAGDGPFTKKCSEWLESNLGVERALLTHSCTAALEMAAILCDLAPGDEVILPSYTFVSSANAFVLRGATPVFVDVRPDTLNIDESLIEAAITPRTKALVVVHYAGVACEMDAIMDIARRNNLMVIEDAAQAISASYKAKPLGTIGDLGCLSFHATKNVVCGEGGALLVNRKDLVERAEIIREKGTDRSNFLRGHVDKYTWKDLGSSFLPSELNAAFLLPQLEASDQINQMRLGVWQRYSDALSAASEQGHFELTRHPIEAMHNAHMFYLIAKTPGEREELADHLKANGISAVTHYVPLHSSPAGLHFGQAATSMQVTNSYSERLLRLPLYPDLQENQRQVIDSVLSFYGLIA